MSDHLSVPQFFAGWLPAAAVSGSVDVPDLAQAFVVPVAGYPIPVVTCGLGLLGVVLARPLARRGESELGLPLFLLVSAIMLIVVQLWIIESRPSWLFAFVVAIGLGFSGYSLIELLGQQMRDFATTIIDQAKGTIGRNRNNGQDQ